MSNGIPEHDWKVFKQLHPIALERYCQKVLRELGQISADASQTPHERYLAVYKLIQQRDKDLSGAFDDLRRSTASLQIGIIYSLGVITEEELTRFTPETRARVLYFFRA